MEQLPRKRKKLKRWIPGLFVSLILIAFFIFIADIRRASAYAILLRTDPADGAVLSSAPAQMRFWFSEPVVAEQSTITLRDGHDKTWDLKPYADTKDLTILLVDLPDLPLNSYYLTWRVISPQNLHASSGSLVFGVQQNVSSAASSLVQSSTPLDLVLHWISLLSFAVVVGGLLIHLLLIPTIRTKIQKEQQLSTLQNMALLSAFGGSIVSLSVGSFVLWDKSREILNICSHSGLLLFKLIVWANTEATPSAIGQLKGLNQQLITDIFSLEWKATSLICINAIVVLILRQLRQKKKLILGNWLLCGFVILWTAFQTLNTHAVAFSESSPLRLIAHSLHLLGTGIWAGGQIGLCLFFAMEVQEGYKNRDFAREIYIQLGGMTATGMAILVITGLYSGGQQIASIDALLFTSYGQTLIIKALLVLLSGLIGLSYFIHFYPEVADLFYRFVSRRTMEFILHGGILPAILRVQLLGGVIIFLLAAFLGTTHPARGPEFDPPAQITTTTEIQPREYSSPSMVNDLLLDISIKPNRPGQNFITVDAFDTRRPSPAPIESVAVEMTSPEKKDPIRVDIPVSEKAGVYQVATDAINLSGDWKISVIVHRTGLEDSVMKIPWVVASLASVAGGRRALISSHPLAPALTITSLLLSVLLISFWLFIISQADWSRWSKNKLIVLRDKDQIT